MADYLRKQQAIDWQTVANVQHETEISMPFVQSGSGKSLVPIIRKVVLDVPLGAGDVPPPVGDFVEYGTSLRATADIAGFAAGNEAVLASYAELHLGYAAAAGASFTGHHGQNETYFPEGIPYPFDKIYLRTYTVNCAAIQWSAVKIFYTMELMTANEILLAREQFK